MVFGRFIKGVEMKTKFLVSVFILTLIVLISCQLNCDKAMENVRNRMGEPDDIDTYSSADYNEVTYWYWSLGIAYIFKWGSSVDGCDESTYTFSPISKDSSETVKANIKQAKKLVDRNIYFDFPIIK